MLIVGDLPITSGLRRVFLGEFANPELRWPSLNDYFDKVNIFVLLNWINADDLYF